MKKIYQNFDGLDVTFQCAIPSYIIKALATAKEEAIASKKEVHIEIGKSRVRIAVAETGMRGGFKYRFSTGLDGAIWCIADYESSEMYSVKVSCSSLMLAMYGYQKTKNKILEFLTEELNAIPPKGRDFPLERINRFDFCIDYMTEDNFEINPNNFVLPNSTKTKFFGNGSEPLIQCVMQENNIKTILVGKMPNKEVTIYNKKNEIREKKKNYWWHIWEINPKENKSPIWRVEIRAGKKELNKWNLRRFDDFEKIVCNVIIHILESYRYVTPNLNDKNRSRWPMQDIWKLSIQAAKNGLAEYYSHEAKREAILIEHCEQTKKRLRDTLTGAATNYAALTGRDISELPTVIEDVNSNIFESVRKNPQKYRKNHEKAEKKYQHLYGKKQNEFSAE